MGERRSEVRRPPPAPAMEGRSGSEREQEPAVRAHEWITPQSCVTALYQSPTEKGIRKVCSELLELKDAVESLCGNMQSKYQAFLRLSHEVVEAEKEITELKEHIAAQGILVQDLISGVSCELDVWNKYDNAKPLDEQKLLLELNEIFQSPLQDPKAAFLDNIDILLAEHKMEEAMQLLVAEEKSFAVSDSTKEQTVDMSSYKMELQKRKDMLEAQIVRYLGQPSLSISEQRKALAGLIKIGRGTAAYQLLLKAHSLRLQKNIESFLPSCPIYPETYAATLSQIVFSAISVVARESASLFGEMPTGMNRTIQWAEEKIEHFVRLVKENSPPFETISALRSANICLQASLSHCSCLESQGLKLSKLVLVLLCPYVEEILDVTFRRARRKVLDIARHEDILLATPDGLQHSAAELSGSILTRDGKKFMSIANDILDQITPMGVLYFGGTILNKIHQLFDRYIETLMKVLPAGSEDDILMELKESTEIKAETDAQQLALIGMAYVIGDEILPVAATKFFRMQAENKAFSGDSTEGLGPGTIFAIEFKDWKRLLQHSLDKLRDHFCRQFVLTFMYLEGKARLDASVYLEGRSDDLYWEADALPSLPFQALFGRLQQLATVASDVLQGKERTQRALLSRIIETVLIWLSEEQDFWDVFADDSVQLQASGLQQLILDMRFVAEIAEYGRYSTRAVHHLVSAITARAIGAFSERGVDQQSALPEDEWFVDTAKSSIRKLLLGTYDTSEPEDGNHIEFEDSDETSSIHSGEDSDNESFASANNGELESPAYD